MLDVDSTLIQNEVIELLVLSLVDARVVEGDFRRRGGDAVGCSGRHFR